MRTDIHSPKNFDPTRYTFVGHIYLGSEPAILMALRDDSRTRDAWVALNTSTYKGNWEDKRTCDHCGTSFMYGAVFRHENGEAIVVGHQCANNAFGYDSRRDYDLRRFMRRVDQAKHQAAMEIQAQNFIIINHLADDLETSHYIINDLKGYLLKYGSLSDKQVALVRKIAAEQRGRMADMEAEKATRAPVICGKIRVCGKVLSTKTVDHGFGYTLKMLVKDDRGFVVWGAVPAALRDALDGRPTWELKGWTVCFTAVVERSKDDETFGFFKRPRKVEIKKEVLI